jgi:hypothetical protein
MRIAAKIADPTAMRWRVEASTCTRGWWDERDQCNRVCRVLSWGDVSRGRWEAGREIGSIQSSQGKMIGRA